MLTALAAVVALSGCSAEAPETAAQPAPTGASLCTEAFAHQQVAATFEPVGPRHATPTLDSLLGVGTLSDGLCLDTATEFYAEGWTVTSIELQGGIDADDPDREPVSFSRTSNLETEHVALHVPLEGCVTVRGTITATRDTTGEARTWRASGTYGRDCPESPGGGHVQ